MKRKGGYAFPGKIHVGINQDGDMYEHPRGMSLRDWFAGQAMKAYITSLDSMHDDTIANYAYTMADAMIERREKS